MSSNILATLLENENISHLQSMNLYTLARTVAYQPTGISQWQHRGLDGSHVIPVKYMFVYIQVMPYHEIKRCYNGVVSNKIWFILQHEGEILGR